MNTAAKCERYSWTGTASIIFLLCLCAAAGILGFLTNKFLSEAENELAEKQFESIADRALDSAYEITLRKRLAGVALASFASTRFPDTESWPFVLVNGYEMIASNLIDMSSGRGIGFAPIIQSEQLETFERFARDHFEASFPTDSRAGYSSFGFGVFGVDPSLNTTDNRYRETGRKARRHNSTNEFLVPILQHNYGPRFGSYLQNIHHDPVRGRVLDDIFDCSQRKHGNEDGDEIRECGEISDMLFGRGEPGAHIIQPIYPANDADVITGFIASSILWREVLENVFADEVKGVDCVLRSETQAYTYTVTAGVASVKGKGDLHDGRYRDYGRTTYLTGPPGVFFGNSSVSYTLTLYPNADLFEVYSTNNPRVAAVVATCTILVTSIVFGLYDCLVRREFHQKQTILEAKRQFVRFLSHEVRTPLNAACMGLQLIQEDIWTSLLQKDIRNKEINSVSDCSKSIEHTISRDKMYEHLLGLCREVRGNTESAVEILNEVLNYDKVEMGTMHLELTLLPIWHLIERTITEFRLSTKAKKVNLSLKFSPFVGNGGADFFSVSLLPQSALEYRVVGDTIRITQVLRNLLSNALKFTPEGGDIAVAASITEAIDKRKSITKKDTFTLVTGEGVAFQRSGFLHVSVSDTGAGMSGDQLAKLFQSGVQFNKNQLQAGNGSGFGLFISKGITQQHAGTLTATSAGLGHGTTRTMTLPLYKVPDSELPHHLQTTKISINHKEVAVAENIGKLRILVVDDSIIKLKLLMCLLEKRGHYCKDAENGKAAIAKIQEAAQVDDKPFDAILLDYEMPEMDGPTTAKEVRAIGSKSFIVGITGNTFPEDVTHFKESGANYVFPKPIRIDALEMTLLENGVSSPTENSQSA